SRPNRLASPAGATTTRGNAAAAGELARNASARDPGSALALAEEVLGRALRIGATEAEVLVMAGDSALTRFANSEIHQNVAERSLTVSLRHVVGRRIAVVSTGRVDADGLRSLVHRAAAIARSCEELDDWAGLPAPIEASSRAAVSAWADGTAEATPEFRAEGVRAVIAAADAVGVTAMLGYLGFSALAVQEGRSFVEPGRRIGSELVTIIDDGADRNGLPMAFDYEGVAKQRVPLVESGVCRDVVYDSQTAARAGRTSTGHGLPAPNPWGPFPLNAVMSAGDTSRDDLVKGLDRGLLVTRFHYTNVVHPKLAMITGMTRDGTFLVERGEVVGPVRNLRFTQSYLDALAGVSAVSSSRKTIRGFLGAAVVPALRIDAWTFTGVTEF